MKRKILAILIFFLSALPLFATAQEFSRQGIFGCSRNAAALNGSVGAFSATGGVYVPVADFTVELNTGTLVYLECVLRGIVDRESESANTAMIQQEVRALNTGNNGNPYFVVNARAEDLAFQDESRLRGLQDQSLLQAMPQEFAAQVQRTSARTYMNDTRNKASELVCPQEGTGADGLDGILRYRYSSCTDISEYFKYEQILASADAEYLDNIQKERDYGRGFYAVTQTNANGDRIVQTPAAYVEEKGLQAVTSGFRRVESANNVDQMVGALYAGLGTQILTGSGGFSGLTTPIGNSASYLTRMTSESAAGLRNAAANAALGILASARAVEQQYNQVVTGIANGLTGNIATLRSMENQCWNLITFNTSTKHVCTAQPTGGSCTGIVSGAALKIATTTQFSQPIIDSQIAPLATQVVANVQKSQQALTLIDQLIQGVSNTTSLDAQRLALVQLDQLVSQGRLHVQADVTAVQQQQTAINDTMVQLIDQTKTTWADSTDVNQGWCNVNNQAVIDMWDSKWR